MGIGDHECDYYPFQIGQFESSTIAINQCLSKINLEARGGGNGGESYLLAWVFAGIHTCIDSLEKRGQKGYLFTIGDEPTLCRISKEKLTELTGHTYEKDYTWQEAYELACEKYHVFHIHIKHGGDSHGVEVDHQMGDILGRHLLICTPEEIVETICSVIKPKATVSILTPTKPTEISEASSPKPQYR